MWNGGVLDLMEGVADVGGASFTASQIRSTVVDFSVPLVEIVCRFFIKNPEVCCQSPVLIIVADFFVSPCNNNNNPLKHQSEGAVVEV